MLLGKYINTRVLNEFIFEYKEIFDYGSSPYWF
jgi:hypothetical protein